MLEIHLAKINYSKADWSVSFFELKRQVKPSEEKFQYVIENYPKTENSTHLSWVIKMDGDDYDKVYIENEEHEEYNLERYTQGNETYYFQKATPIKEGGRFTYDSKKANIGFSVPGTVVINGRKQNKVSTLARLTFSPSILTVPELQEMLFELFQFHHQSFINPERQERVFSGNLYNIQSLLNHLNILSTVLQQINHSPLVELVRTHQYESVHQMRSFDIRLEINKELNPGLPKYKGTQYVHEVNTLENQIIKQILLDLMEHVDSLEKFPHLHRDYLEPIQYIKSKVNKLLSLPLFKNVHVQSKVGLRPTQLFINDQRYRAIWQSLKYIEKEVHFSIDEEQFLDQYVERLSPTFTYQIYETWVYFKMIHILVKEMGWEIRESEKFKEQINSFYAKADKNDYNGLPANYFVRLVKGELQVDVIYEFQKGVRPDFTFIYKYKNYPLGQAILDAKLQSFEHLRSEKGTKESELEAVYRKYKIGLNKSEEEEVYSVGVLYPESLSEARKDRNPYDFSPYLNFEKTEMDKVNMSGLRMRPNATSEFKNWFMLILEIGMKASKSCPGCGGDQLVKESQLKGDTYLSQLGCSKCSYRLEQQFHLHTD